MKRYLQIDPKIRPKPDDLLYVPVIIRVQKFTEDAAKQFADDMQKAHDTGQPVIPVLVDSYGGSVHACLSMVTDIQNAKVPVVTVCESKAMSAGAVLFTCGSERYVGPHASIMIHEVSSWTGGKVEEIKADAAETDRLNTYIFKLMARNCGHADEEDYFLKVIHDKKHAEWFLAPKEAIKENVATKLGVPSLNVKVKVDIDLSL